MYSYCINVSGSGGDIPPGGGGGAEYGNTVSPSNLTGYIGIKNELKDPCFLAVWNLVRDANFNNSIQNILYDFNESSSLVFTLKEDNDPTHPTRPATTAHGSNNDVIITLNTFALAFASKEAILTTIYPEVAHVYLNGCVQLDDHNFMADNYIAPMAQAIEGWYVNLPGGDATQLAWFGLGLTDAWRDMTPQMRNEIVDCQRLYFNFQNQYDPNQIMGTRC